MSGQVNISYITFNDPYQHSVDVWRGTTNVFSAATKIDILFVSPNISSYAVDSSLAAGTYYYWLQPRNKRGAAGPLSGPHTATVT